MRSSLFYSELRPVQTQDNIEDDEKINYISNPYESKIMAPLYERPDFLYTELFNKIAKTKQISHVKKALDVGCGTGISTRALKQTIADEVVGVDISQPMLDTAISQFKPDPGIKYLKAAAETLPFTNESFDLISICVAPHWVDQAKFLQESARVLKDNGQLIIGHYGFTGIETPEFAHWKENVFFKHYPYIPAKRSYNKFQDKITEFPVADELKYIERFELTIGEFANLLMSMGGVVEKIEKNNLQPEKTKDWLIEELKPFFAGKEKVTFRMDMSAWLLQRIPRLELLHSSSRKEAEPQTPFKMSRL